MSNTLRIPAAGGTGYIEKPIDPDTSVDDIREHFKNPAKGDK